MDGGAGRQARDFVAAWQRRAAECRWSQSTRFSDGSTRAAMPVCERRRRGSRKPGALAAMSRHDKPHPMFHWPSFSLLRTERRRSKGNKPHESWGSGDGSSTSLASRDPVAQMERDVTPSKGMRGEPRDQSVVRFKRVQALERRKPKKGSTAGLVGGLPPDITVSERTRRGIKAL